MHTEASPTDLLNRVAADFKSKPFVPPRVLTQGDLQTIAAYCWPGRFKPRDTTGDEERLFEVEPGSRVLARCRWQANRAGHATLVMWHGMEGSTESAYMLTTAEKAYRAGFNVVRVNVRNCGGTDHLSPTLYHAGLTSDLRVIIDELIRIDGMSRIIIAGFSLGGNMTLKLAGEYGDEPPAEVKAICAISPSVDLGASTSLMALRRNWLYQRSFLKRLKMRILKKAELFPGRYDPSHLREIKSVQQFDNLYIAPAFGFADANDYYAKASSLHFIARIRIPTLIIHAQDDPFIPFAPLQDPSIAANSFVMLVTPRLGGHVAFLAKESPNEDRFWAENRLIDFCRMIAE
jgi:uncharacterized protein